MDLPTPTEATSKRYSFPGETHPGCKVIDVLLGNGMEEEDERVTSGLPRGVPHSTRDSLMPRASKT